MIPIWLVYNILVLVGLARAQECKKQHNSNCENYQEVFCSSECLPQGGTIGYFQDGSTFTCDVKSANNNIPRPTVNDSTAVDPKGFRINCYTTSIENVPNLIIPALNISWDQEEGHIYNKDVVGYYLSQDNLIYQVFIDIKKAKKPNEVNPTRNRCIRFRYDCFGVKNDVLKEHQNMRFWLASVPMSQRDDDTRNGLCVDYSIPNMDECGKIPPTTTEAESTTEYYTRNAEAQSSHSSNTSLIAVISILLSVTVVVGFAIIRKLVTKIKQQEDKINGDYILMVTDIKKKDCSQEHEIAAMIREKLPETRVVCDWENRNDAINANWYTQPMCYANIVIFFDGVKEMKTLENSPTQFTYHSILSHFFVQSVNNIRKPSIFLVGNEEDMKYIQNFHKEKNCYAYLQEKSTTDEFYNFLKSLTVNKLVNHAKNSTHRQRKTNGYKERKQNKIREEQETLINNSNTVKKETKKSTKSGEIVIEMKTLGETNNHDKDQNGNTMLNGHGADYYTRRGAKPKQMTNRV